jgi:hypothetical protein
MIRRRTPSQRTSHLATAAVLTVGLAIAVHTGSAATLGPIFAGSIFTQESPVSIDIPDPPGPIVSTDFSGCANFIDGWTDESGNTWRSRSGDWQCLGSGVVRALERVPLANLTVDIAQSTGIRVSTEISDISHQRDRSGPGLSLLGDGVGNHVYVVYERDQERLAIGLSGAGAPFALVTQVGDWDGATLTATITGTQLTVDFAGFVLVFDLTVEAPGLIGNTEFGLVSDNDNQSRFTSFTIEAVS